MSAWSMATRGRLAVNAPGASASATNTVEFIGRLTKWIPGEIVALYALRVAQLQPDQPDSGPVAPPVVSGLTWFIALLATPIVVSALALAAQKKKIIWRAVFSIPAFAVWSATVPHSGWRAWDFFNKNEGTVYFVLALLAIVIAALAESVLPKEQ